MAPIRTAIIGLSANAITSWAAAAHLPYLISPAGKTRFEIIALCNSSVESAKAAIKKYDLPTSTRAYGSPEELANDSDVELVVVSTRVDKHYETAYPSVKAGKNVYVEWPLAENAVRAGELAELAREKGGKTVVGLQGRFSPVAIKSRELIASGRIGKVLSTEVRAAGGGKDRETLNSGLKYFTDRKIGGNVLTIGGGHLSDIVQFVLGEIQDAQSLLQIQRPIVKLVDPASGQITEVVKTNVPDLIYITGSLPESEKVVKGASLSLRYRRGQPFKGEPGLVWTINGEKGEIRVSSSNGPGINANSEDVVIEVHDYETDKVQEIDWEWGPFAGLPPTAKNIAALYEAYADGLASKYADFEHALKRHRQLDGFLAAYDAAKPV